MHCAVSGNPTPSVRFQAKYSDALIDGDISPEKVRQTLANARQAGSMIDDNPYSPQPVAKPAKVRSRMSKLKTGLKFYLNGMGKIIGFFAASAAFFGVGAHMESQKIQTLESRITTEGVRDLNTIKELETAKSIYGSASRFYTLSLWASGIMLTVPLFMVAFAARGVRKDLFSSEKMMPGIMMQVVKTKKPNEQRLVEILERGIQLNAKKLSDNFKEAYDNHPQAREVFNEVFGGRKNLPSGEEIERLFKYYAFLQIMKEKSPNGKPLKSPISDFDMQKKVYALLKTGMNMGDKMFAFVVDKKDYLLDQEFNPMMAVKTVQLEMQIDQQLSDLVELLNRQVEIDNYLQTAQRAFAFTAVSGKNHKKELAMLETQIEKMKQQKVKIDDVLNRQDDRLEVDAEVMLEVKASLLNMINQLQVFIDDEGIRQTAEKLAEESDVKLAADRLLAEIAQQEEAESLKAEKPQGFGDFGDQRKGSSSTGLK